MLAGLVLLAAGVIVTLAERGGVRLGQLPGDVVWRGKNSTVYFPVVTSLLLSVLLTLVMWLFRR